MTFVVDYLYPKQGKKTIRSKDYTGSQRKGILPIGRQGDKKKKIEKSTMGV